MAADVVMLQVLAGLASAAVLFLVASGLTLIFGTMRVINMAHGSFYMLGAFLLATVFQTLAANGIGFWIALIVIGAMIAALGGVMEVLILRPLYKRQHLMQIVATWSVLLIVGDLAQSVWGALYRSAPSPLYLSGGLTIGGETFPVYDIFLVGITLLLWIGLSLMLSRTNLGRLIRAAVEDRELLEVLGVNVRQLFTSVFALGIFLAAIGGALVAPIVAVGPGMDIQIIVEAFAVAVIGGLGNITGAFASALIIGLFQAFATTFMPSLSGFVVYLVMIAVLLIRPAGLFGTREI